MPRGGRRQGRVGVAYGNRSDLNSQVPVSAAPGQMYGQAAAQLEAQRVVPMRSAPAVPSSPSGPDGPPPTGPGPDGPLPGSLPGLHAPSVRPGEPVTAGLPVGAGPGPEVLPFGMMEQRTLVDAIGAIADAPGASADVRALLGWLQQGRR